MSSRRTRTFAGYQLVTGKHAFDRYCSRIWPEHDRGECHQRLDEAMVEFAALRETTKCKRRKDHDTWLLLFGGERPFAILARLKIGYFNGDLAHYFRAITCLAGHAHH